MNDDTEVDVDEAELHHTQVKHSDPPEPITRTRPQPSVARFDALVKEAKVSMKGETIVSFAVPWENREQGLELMMLQGIMVEVRVTRKRRS